MGIQSNIEVDSRCATSNLPTDKVSLLYTQIIRGVIIITVVETVQKVKQNIYNKLEANFQLFPDFIRLRLNLKCADLGR
jgi:hypothetical protein